MKSPARLLLLLVAFAPACRRGPRSTDLSPPPARDVVRDLPNWYVRPPTEDNFIFGAATAVSQDVQIAVNKAQTEGRLMVAQQLEVKYGAMNKRFAEEVGREASSQLLDQYTQVYKATVSQMLYGSRARQQTIRAEGGVYRAFVLIELPLGEMAKKLMEQVRASEQLYTRFRATEAFKELDAELQRYETWKRQQR
jgi:hypothetical protein